MSAFALFVYGLSRQLTGAPERVGGSSSMLEKFLALSLECIGFPNIHSSGKLSQCRYPGLITQRNSAVLCNRRLSIKMKCVPLDSGWGVPL
jgi:hypothetical protein